MKDLKQMLESFFGGKRNFYKRGKFSIGTGGYDLCYEIYYNGIPIIQNVAGRLEILKDNIDIDANKILNIVTEFENKWRVKNGF